MNRKYMINIPSMNRYITITLSFLALMLIGCQGAEVKGPYASLSSPYKSPYRPIETLEPGTILHVPTGTTLSKEELFSYISNSNIVYVGESHKSVNHHRIQLDIIKALYAEFPETLSVGMEMFKTSSQDELNEWLDGDLDEKTFFKLWMSNWGVNYEYYREILEYIKENNIPLIALNAPPEFIKALAHKTGGTDDIPALELPIEELPAIDTTDPYHRAMTEAVFSDPNHARSSFDSFYNIQLLWEETMAESIAKYLMSENGLDKRMVVLSGGGHINYGFGIPKRLFRRLSEPYTTIIPISTDLLRDEEAAKAAIEKGAQFLDVELPHVPLHIADFVWATTFETLTSEPPKLGVYLVEEADQVAITIVSEGTSAQEYGLMEGDVITKLDEDVINDILDIKYFLKSKSYGDRIVVSVIRGGQPLNIKMMLKPLLKRN